MSRLKLIFSIFSYSFTMIILLLALFSWLGVFSPMSEKDVFIIGLMLVLTTILTHGISLLPLERVWLNIVLHIGAISSVVFGIGLLMDFIPATPIYLLITLGMIVVVYLLVRGLLVIRDQADAKEINQRLSKWKEEALREKLQEKQER